MSRENNSGYGVVYLHNDYYRLFFGKIDYLPHGCIAIYDSYIVTWYNGYDQIFNGISNKNQIEYKSDFICISNNYVVFMLNNDHKNKWLESLEKTN